MSYFLIAAKILLILPTILKIAETLFKDKPESGKEKKSWVLSLVESIYASMIGISTGGQLETWMELKALIGPLIDQLCNLLFPHDEVNKK